MTIIMLIALAGCASLPPANIVPTVPFLAQNISGAQHRVQAGQTLWRIAKLYNVDIDEILKLNHLSEESTIEIGQLLLIPQRTNFQNAPIKTEGSDFIWPLKGRIICGFGANYRNLINKGINIQAASNVDILASRSGRVVFYTANLGNFGKTIIIDHGDGLRSVYSRIGEVFVRIGDEISKGTVIGRVGTSVRDKNNFLHFEIRKGALPQNPLFYLL